MVVACPLLPMYCHTARGPVLPARDAVRPSPESLFCHVREAFSSVVIVVRWRSISSCRFRDASVSAWSHPNTSTERGSIVPIENFSILNNSLHSHGQHAARSGSQRRCLLYQQSKLLADLSPLLQPICVPMCMHRLFSSCCLQQYALLGYRLLSNITLSF
jgi:hypothetical protein